MKGSVVLRSDVKSPYWFVSWPHYGKVYKISRYFGESEPMHQTHPKRERDLGYQKSASVKPSLYLRGVRGSYGATSPKTAGFEPTPFGKHQGAEPLYRPMFNGGGLPQDHGTERISDYGPGKTTRNL